MTHRDSPITADVIERFLIEKHWWLSQPHTRLAYRIIRKLAAENAELHAKLGIKERSHVDKVIKQRRQP